jgi:hypothetical protein
MQQTINSSFDDQYAGIVSLFCCELVEVDQLAFVSLILEKLLCFYHFLSGKTFFSWSSNYLHALMVLCLVAKCNSNRAHPYISF